MRPLSLHVSALNDAEYQLYTTSLDDLATLPTDYDRRSVGVREARAWLRGRYSDLPASDIDAILKFFCPSMLPSDTLTGGQFFAALRLVVHAQSGKGVDRTLAFVQASPTPAKAIDPPSPPKRPVQAPPAHPDRQKPPPPASNPETNPFTRRSTEHVVPAPPPDPDPTPALPLLQKRPGKLGHNPFLARDLAEPANASTHAKLPPLPPRKPPSLAVRRVSEADPTPISSSAGPLSPPLIPLKPTHVMSPLMRQSLEASKHAQSMKRAEEQLDRERVLQVLKTTSSSSGSSSTTTARTRSLSPAKQAHGLANDCTPDSGSAPSDDATYVPPLPRRRKTSRPSSASSSSALSFDQVANATLPSPTARPPLPSRDVLFATQTQTDASAGPIPIPPPTHPHRRPTDGTTTDARTSPPSSPRAPRSDELAASSSTLPPPPPRRKRRPESVQLTPTSTPTADAPPPVSFPRHARATSYHHQGLSRHLSLTRDCPSVTDASSSSRIANIRETLTHLQLKAQPRLDAVRYKAEAGISRRGYVHGVGRRDEGEQGLMAESRWTAANVDRDPDSEPTTTTDEEASEDEGEARRRRTTTTGAAPCRDLTGADHLKWPMGEGWKPL